MIYSDRTMFSQQASPMTSFVGRATPDQLPMVPTGGFGNYGMGGGGFPQMMGMGGGFPSPFGYGGGFPSMGMGGGFPQMMGMGGGFPSPFGYGGGFPSMMGAYSPMQGYGQAPSMGRQYQTPTTYSATVMPSEPLPDPSAPQMLSTGDGGFAMTGGGYMRPAPTQQVFSAVAQPTSGGLGSGPGEMGSELRAAGLDNPPPSLDMRPGYFPSQAEMQANAARVKQWEQQSGMSAKDWYAKKEAFDTDYQKRMNEALQKQEAAGGAPAATAAQAAAPQATASRGVPQGSMSSLFGGLGGGYGSPFASGGFNPYGGGFSPYGGGFNPYGGGFSPYGGGFSPYGGGFSPFGMLSPYG